MRRIRKIVIHCADTFHDMDVNAEWVRNIHVNENGLRDIGYHYVITRNGEVENGRDEAVAGAHVRGHNANSIGVCLIGGKARAFNGQHSNPANFTHKQWETLRNLVKQLLLEYPAAKVVGHCDLDSTKNCPSFDVVAWSKDL